MSKSPYYPGIGIMFCLPSGIMLSSGIGGEGMSGVDNPVLFVLGMLLLYTGGWFMGKGSNG